MKAVVVENYDCIDNIRLQDVAMPDVKHSDPRNASAQGGLRRSSLGVAERGRRPLA